MSSPQLPVEHCQNCSVEISLTHIDACGKCGYGRTPTTNEHGEPPSSSQHTKPARRWELHIESLDTLLIKGKPCFHIGTEDGEDIAFVPMGQGSNSVEESYARLIAAAPELLAAAVSAEAALSKRLSTGRYDSAESEAQQILRSALAKAQPPSHS